MVPLKSSDFSSCSRPKYGQSRGVSSTFRHAPWYFQATRETIVYWDNQKYMCVTAYSVNIEYVFFPTCQVRVVRFYQSCRLLLPPPPPPPPSPRLLLPPDLNYSHPRQVLAAGPQPRPSQPSVGCRTPTTASPAQCWLPDLNHGHPGAVLAAGPQPPCQI